MKINKLNLKRGAKLLALSLALVTSGVTMSGCAKNNEKKVESNSESDLELSTYLCKYVDSLLESGTAFVTPEKIVVKNGDENSNGMKLPLGYSLYTVDHSTSTAGLVSIDEQDDCVIYCAGNRIDSNGESVSPEFGGCIGVNQKLIDLMWFNEYMVAGLKDTDNWNPYRVNAFISKADDGSYMARVPSGYSLYYIGEEDVNVSEFIFLQEEDEGSYIIPAGTDVENLIGIDNEIKHVLNYSDIILKAIEDAYNKQVGQDDIKTK